MLPARRLQSIATAGKRPARSPGRTWAGSKPGRKVEEAVKAAETSLAADDPETRARTNSALAQLEAAIAPCAGTHGGFEDGDAKVANAREDLEAREQSLETPAPVGTGFLLAAGPSGLGPDSAFPRRGPGLLHCPRDRESWAMSHPSQPRQPSPDHSHGGAIFMPGRCSRYLSCGDVQGRTGELGFWADLCPLGRDAGPLARGLTLTTAYGGGPRTVSLDG